MRSVVFLGFLVAFWIWYGSCTGVEGKPVRDSFSDFVDKTSGMFHDNSGFFDKTKDVLQGKRDFNVRVSSNGVRVSVGPSTEEIAAYVAFGLGILIIGICCCCCCKHCCCAPKPQPTTIIYQQMTQPRTNGFTNPSNSRFGGPVEAPTVNFDPMPNVAEISKRQPPPYSTTNCSTNIPLWSEYPCSKLTKFRESTIYNYYQFVSNNHSSWVALSIFCKKVVII